MERNDWHLRESSAVLHSLKTDMYKGLDRTQARKRSRIHGANRVWYVHRVSAKEYALACLSDLATVLLVITAVFAAILFREIPGWGQIVGGAVVIAGVFWYSVEERRSLRRNDGNKT